MTARALIALTSALAMVGGGYWWGHTATDNAWQAKHAKELKAERAATAKETKRADQAAANYLTEHLDQEDRYAALSATYQDLRRRVPLVVPGPVVVVKRLRVVEQKAAVAGAISGSAVSIGIALAIEGVKQWLGRGGAGQ